MDVNEPQIAHAILDAYLAGAEWQRRHIERAGKPAPKERAEAMAGDFAVDRVDELLGRTDPDQEADGE